MLMVDLGFVLRRLIRLGIGGCIKVLSGFRVGLGVKFLKVYSLNEVIVRKIYFIFWFFNCRIEVFY